MQFDSIITEIPSPMTETGKGLRLRENYCLRQPGDPSNCFGTTGMLLLDYSAKFIHSIDWMARRWLYNWQNNRGISSASATNYILLFMFDNPLTIKLVKIQGIHNHRHFYLYFAILWTSDQVSV